MIWFSLRQFRIQALTVIVLLVAAGLLLGVSGPHLAHLYDVAARSNAACRITPSCQPTGVQLSKFYQLLRLIGTALVGLPAILGAFWGAPLIAREFEQGTHRLIWTQSIPRIRWLVVKLAVVGTASVVVTGILSLMVTLWSQPIDRSDANRFAVGLFGERDIVPLGYAAFGFVLGVLVGLLVRRTLGAMAITLALFLTVRLTFAYVVRPHLVSPRHTDVALADVVQGFGSSDGGNPSLFFGPPTMPNAWVYSTRVVDAAGHQLTSATVASTCPELPRQLGEPGSGVGSTSVVDASGHARDAVQICTTRLSSQYHGVVTYQPANRYWLFQWLELTAFGLATLLLIYLCLLVIRRRGA